MTRDIQGGPVADDATNNPRPFNVRTVKFLVGLMSQHDLSEIDLREGIKRTTEYFRAVLATID